LSRTPSASHVSLLDRLELRLPPVLLALICLAAMWGVSRSFPSLDVALRFRGAISAAIATVGVAVGLAGVATFRRSRTTVDPTRPDRASTLVASGIYRVTRNPMYVALALALVAAAIWFSNMLAVIVVPVFIAWITRLQIIPEERALRARFGAGYDDYAARVPRWL
jgi:protein-S-isoprenylcysteine O-methyltransferase Ste14